jgi:hypothetical protein
MSDQELGAFSEGCAGWRRILASVPQEDRLRVFSNAAEEIAGYVARGLARPVAADELSDMAVANGLTDDDQIQAIIGGAFALVRDQDVIPDEIEEPKVNGHDKQAPARTVTPTQYVLPDPSNIPKRGWLYARHYMRGIVTATVAPGGFGKTSLNLFEALEMVKTGLRVWFISAEDDRDEIDRRIAAYVARHGMTPMQMADNFFVDDKLTLPMKLAQMGKNGPDFNNELLAAFDAAIAFYRLDVVIFDPFISFHYLPENDTGSMDALVKRLGKIASERQCNIEISHHVRKPAMNQAEITVHDARGAGAIVNAVRSCRVLNTMSSAEVAAVNAAATQERHKIDPDKRTSYLRIDSGKRNMAPPEKARWIRLVSVEIENGDHVQAVEPYEFPATFANVSTEDLDYVRGLLRAKDYRADPRSPEWIGHPVMKKFSRKPVETVPKVKYGKGDVIWLNKLLATWEANGVLVREEREDEHRKVRVWFTSPERKRADPKVEDEDRASATEDMFNG